MKDATFSASQYLVDVLPTDKSEGFWIQTATAPTKGLTMPSPRGDAPPHTTVVPLVRFKFYALDFPAQRLI